MNKPKVTKGPNGEEVSLKKVTTYFREIIKQLMELAEQEYDTNGETSYFIQEALMRNHLFGLGYNPRDVMPKMMAKGFLKIKRSHPPGYYLCQEDLADDIEVPVSTKTLRQLAQRLWKYALVAKEGDQEKRFRPLKEVQQALIRWGYDPDQIIKQMIAKKYLIQKNDLLLIFRTQKQGENFVSTK